MNSCHPLLQDAVINKQAEGRHLAFLHDRTLTMAGKPQKYGTQFKNNEEGKVVPFPIENPEIVDDLRVHFALTTKCWDLGVDKSATLLGFEKKKDIGSET